VSVRFDGGLGSFYVPIRALEPIHGSREQEVVRVLMGAHAAKTALVRFGVEEDAGEDTDIILDIAGGGAVQDVLPSYYTVLLEQAAA
jgi:hypothetical protein